MSWTDHVDSAGNSLVKQQGTPAVQSAISAVTQQASGKPAPKESGLATLGNDSMAEYNELYQPVVDKLGEQASSTKLIDDAKGNAQQRYDRTVGAANRLRNRDAGLTSTRADVVAAYKDQLGAAKAVDGSVNNAYSNQDEVNSAAKSQLFNVNKELLNVETQAQQHKEGLETQREIANANIAAQKSAANKQLFGSVLGGAIGLAAAI